MPPVELGIRQYVRVDVKWPDRREDVLNALDTLAADALLTHLGVFRPGASREDFLFTNRNGDLIARSGFSRDVLKPALARAGIVDRHITWVSLRHTAASLMFDAGLTLFDVQRRLGHKSPLMTAEVYTHLMRERYEEGRVRMEEYGSSQLRV